MVYIGVDLGGTNIAVGLVDEEGKILHKDSVPTLLERGPEPVIKDMAHLSLKVIKDAGYTLDDVKAIGVGVPGLADKTGVVIFCTNLRWHMVPLREIMQSIIDKPVYIDNDATVAGLAESVAGVSKGVANSVFLTLGTGVGGGIVIDHKIYSGSHGVGSELGHMTVQCEGRRCTCGSIGCWEQYSSATALIRQGREAVEKNPDSLIVKMVNGDLDKIEARTVIDAARQGDKVACEVYDKYIYYLAIGIVAIINAFDPEVIALGGGVSKAGDFLLEPLRKKVAEYVFYKDLPYARIEIATLGNDAGIIGAAMLGK